MEKAISTSYFAIAKPGILCGNALTCAAGLALSGSLDPIPIIGLSSIVAAGCIANNIIDRSIDAKMIRTKNRPLATGSIAPQSAAFLALALAALGTLLLALFTTPLATSLALLGLFFYLALYTPLKYRTPHATLVGAIAGALPPVIGYAAHRPLDTQALLLFLLLALWQMPHFYAIALRRIDEYAAASIPIFPLIYGVRTTQTHMLLYLFAFTALAAYLTPFSLLFTLPWLALSFMRPSDIHRWARNMFFASLAAILGISALLLVQ